MHALNCAKCHAVPTSTTFLPMANSINGHFLVTQKQKKYSAVGGTLEATLKVDHVSVNAKHPEKYPAHSVVVGQIHAKKHNELIKAKTGYGHGNEPLKIFYKKFPGHEYGSVFWNYERNLAKKDPNRADIAYLFGAILGKTNKIRVRQASSWVKSLATVSK